MEKEFQVVKKLLESGKFDNYMNVDEKKSNEASKNQENEKSRNILSISKCLFRRMKMNKDNSNTAH